MSCPDSTMIGVLSSIISSERCLYKRPVRGYRFAACGERVHVLVILRASSALIAS
jgi:hypothetical protein